MKIEIEIRRTYNETIKLTDDNLLEINDEYKGDVKRWVENNYSDLMYLDCPDDEDIERAIIDGEEIIDDNIDLDEVEEIEEEIEDEIQEEADAIEDENDK